jgi:hypothetical protein
MPDPRERARRRRGILVFVGSTIALVLVVTFLVRSASTDVTTEARGVRAAAVHRAQTSATYAPPSRFALDKMTEALLWHSDDAEQLEFVRQDIQRVMRCAPTAWLHETVDLRAKSALAAFGDEHGRFVERHDPARGFLIGDAERKRGPRRVERMTIAWRCAG